MVIKIKHLNKQYGYNIKTRRAKHSEHYDSELHTVFVKTIICVCYSGKSEVCINLQISDHVNFRKDNYYERASMGSKSINNYCRLF